MAVFFLLGVIYEKRCWFCCPATTYLPDWLFVLDTPNFAPAPELWRWIKEIFLNPEHKLFNLDHQHLGAFYYP